ncbi:MAG: toxin-antitoxin system HicB family antitoxin [Pirellulaceae bacterium]
MEMAVATPAHSHEDRKEAAQRIAAEMFQQQPDWITFFREVLGVDGLVRRLFASPEDLAAFERTPQYAEIQQMLARLRDRVAMPDGKEPTRVITVRLPKSLHESLRAEAHDRKTSMNQLCISKLLAVMEEAEQEMPAE